MLLQFIYRQQNLPVFSTNLFFYSVAPVHRARDDVVGRGGPTTATRMDKFTRTMLEKAGLAGMIGKAERGQIAIDAIRDNKAVSMIAVGGAAYLVAKAITKSSLLAFPELGMEAIYEFEVKDMPVTVSVDSTGESVHIEGPKIWSKKIAEKIAVKQM
jgi:fumarate hydratase class I